MTKEQEEAINNIKVFIRSIRSDLVEESKDNQKLANDIEAVLNMLKENSAEIEQKNTELAEKSAEIEKKNTRINDLEYALLDMVMQFADRPNIKGSNYALNTMGLSALELAFDVLGFDDPYPVKKAEEKYKILVKQYFERKSKE